MPILHHLLFLAFMLFQLTAHSAPLTKGEGRSLGVISTRVVGPTDSLMSISFESYGHYGYWSDLAELNELPAERVGRLPNGHRLKIFELPCIKDSKPECEGLSWKKLIGVCMIKHQKVISSACQAYLAPCKSAKEAYCPGLNWNQGLDACLGKHFSRLTPFCRRRLLKSGWEPE